MYRVTQIGMIALLLACGGKKRDEQASGTGTAAGEAAGAEPPAAASADRGGEPKPAAGKPDVKEQSKAAMKGKQLLAYAREPLTTTDVEETLAFAKAWKANAANTKAGAAFEEAEEATANRDETTASEMRKTRTIATSVNALERSQEAFYAQIAASGGPERHYGRSIRVDLAIAAAEQVGKTAKQDATSDAVADLMLEQRAEIAKELVASLEEVRAAKQRGDRHMPVVTAFAQGPGALAMALLPEASLKMWRQLRVEQRQQARDAVKEALNPFRYLSGMPDYPAGATFYAAAIDIAEETPEQLLPR